MIVLQVNKKAVGYHTDGPQDVVTVASLHP